MPSNPPAVVQAAEPPRTRPRDPYLQPNGTLRNKLGIADPQRLNAHERAGSLYGTASIRAGDHATFKHTADGHRQIHQVLFGSTYAWAGRIRQVDLPPIRLASGREIVSLPHGRVAAGLRQAFDQLRPAIARVEAEAAKPRERRDVEFVAGVLAAHAATLGYVRPFRAGSGRALRQGLENVAAAANLHFDQDPLDRGAKRDQRRAEWREALGRAVLDPRDTRLLRDTIASHLLPRERLAERLAEVMAQRGRRPNPSRESRRESWLAIGE